MGSEQRKLVVQSSMFNVLWKGD